MKKSRMQSKVKSKNADTTITAISAKSSGLDNTDNILVKTEYSDLVQELSDGDFADDSFTATYTHDPDSTSFN